jgi:FKBP-type peptidyl-prolyl cis-trans isomerase
MFATTTTTTTRASAMKTTVASPSISRASPRVARVARPSDARGGTVLVSAIGDDVPAPSAAFLGTRRAALALAATTIVPTLAASAEYGDTVYMDALQGKGKDYGKKEVLYPDFERTASGLQYKDMVLGAADAKTFDPTEGKTAVIDWDGYTIGYYGRPFEARNKSKGGAFTGDEKDFFRFKADDERVIGAFREAIVGMKIGSIRRIIVPANNEKLGYPDGKKWRTMKPQPANFSGDRALGFVLENQGMIDKTLLFDIELLKIID